MSKIHGQLIWCCIGYNCVLTDGVDTGGSAGVTTSGASRSSGSLSGSIGDGVAGARASTLEGVVETKPVAGFMSESLAEVVVGGGAAREGRVEDDYM